MAKKISLAISILKPVTKCYQLPQVVPFLVKEQSLSRKWMITSRKMIKKSTWVLTTTMATNRWLWQVLMKVIRHRTRPRPPHNLTQPLLRQHRASLSPSPTQPHLRRPIANQWMLLKRRMLKIKITRVMDRGFQLNAQKMERMRLRGHQHLWSNQARVSRSS